MYCFIKILLFSIIIINVVNCYYNHRNDFYMNNYPPYNYGYYPNPSESYDPDNHFEDNGDYEHSGDGFDPDDHFQDSYGGHVNVGRMPDPYTGYNARPIQGAYGKPRFRGNVKPYKNRPERPRKPGFHGTLERPPFGCANPYQCRPAPPKRRGNQGPNGRKPRPGSIKPIAKKDNSDIVFENIANKVIALDKLISSHCLKYPYEVYEVYGRDGYTLEYKLPRGYTNNDIDVKVKHRVVYVKGNNRYKGKFTDMQSLSDILDMQQANWSVEDEMLKIMIPYKLHTLRTFKQKALKTCDDVINATTIAVSSLGDDISVDYRSLKINV